MDLRPLIDGCKELNLTEKQYGTLLKQCRKLRRAIRKRSIEQYGIEKTLVVYNPENISEPLRDELHELLDALGMSYIGFPSVEPTMIILSDQLEALGVKSLWKNVKYTFGPGETFDRHGYTAVHPMRGSLDMHYDYITPVKDEEALRGQIIQFAKTKGWITMEKLQ